MTDSTTTPAAARAARRSRRRARPPVSPWALWFTVLGGTVAWFLHLGIAWSVMELSCIDLTEGDLVAQRAGDPGALAWWLVGAGTVAPWLVTAAAAVTGLLVRRRQRRVADVLDELATGRIELLLVVGIVLDLLALVAITGGGIALLVLEPCG